MTAKDMQRALDGDVVDDDAEAEAKEDYSEKLSRWKDMAINALEDARWWATLHIVHKALGLGHTKAQHVQPNCYPRVKTLAAGHGATGCHDK